jgi:gas vesicle protein
MSDKESKKSSKLMTGIVIGGALGSLASWVFGSKKRRQQFAEKAQEHLEMGAEEIENRLSQTEEISQIGEKKRGLLYRLFHRNKE